MLQTADSGKNWSSCGSVYVPPGDICNTQLHAVWPFVLRHSQICLWDFVRAFMVVLYGKHSSNNVLM